MTRGKPSEAGRRAARIDAHVGAALRRLRSDGGVTQEQLGEALGVSFQQLQKYEAGTNRIGAGRLAVVARFLGRDIAEFFPDDEAAPPIPARSRADLETVKALARIKNAGLRRTVRRVVRILAEDAA